MQIAGSVRHARQASLAQQAPHRCDFLARTRRLPQVAASHRRAVCRLAVARVRACLDVQMRVTPRHVHHPCTEVKQGKHAIHIAYPPHAVPCPRQGCILLAHIMLGDGSLQGRCMVVHMPNALALEQVSTVKLRCCSAWWSRGVRHAPRNCPVTNQQSRRSPSAQFMLVRLCVRSVHRSNARTKRTSGSVRAVP